MNDKKTLLVYYSFEGNSECAAEMIKAAAGYDSEKLIPDKEPPRSGPGKFLKGGGSVIKKEKVGLKKPVYDPKEYERIILLCPVWASSFPPAIRTYLSDFDLKDKEIYMIGCSTSGHAERMFDKAQAFIGTDFAGTLSLKDPLKFREEAESAIKDFIEKL